jgi:hypothetical protein
MVVKEDKRGELLLPTEPMEKLLEEPLARRRLFSIQ